MMRLLTTGISDWLAKENVILPSDTNLYAYAIRCFLFGMLPLLMDLFWGVIFECLIESIILFIPFMLIRKFCGGFHFKSPLKCSLVSFLIIGISVFAMNTMQKSTISVSLTVLVLISVISICLFSPIDSAARKLSFHERVYFQKIARGLAIITAALHLILLAIGETYWAVPIGIGIIVSAALQIPCIIQKGLHKCNIDAVE